MIGLTILVVLTAAVGCGDDGKSSSPTSSVQAAPESSAATAAALKRRVAALAKRRQQLRARRLARTRARATAHRHLVARQKALAAKRKLEAQQRQREEERQQEQQQATNCDPSYKGACLDPNASDYDCAGGDGDGPKYTGQVQVVGDDHYDLDRDGDGTGCD